jgi:hypothetical protein
MGRAYAILLVAFASAAASLAPGLLVPHGRPRRYRDEFAGATAHFELALRADPAAFGAAAGRDPPH